MCYYNPSKSVKLNMDVGPGASNSETITIDRRFLVSYLIDHCRSCGVKFIFETEITEAITKDRRVLGFRGIKDGKETEFTADMIIDAAGMFSPLRSSLPEEFGIQKDFPVDETIEIYRAYYENTDKYITAPNYSVFFYDVTQGGIRVSLVLFLYVPSNTEKMSIGFSVDICFHVVYRGGKYLLRFNLYHSVLKNICKGACNKVRDHDTRQEPTLKCAGYLLAVLFCAKTLVA